MKTEENKYMSPEVRVIVFEASALICTSVTPSAQSEGYEDGDTTGWYN